MKIKVSLIRTGLIVFTLTAALTANAVDYYWNTAADGVFSTDGNWKYFHPVDEIWVNEGVPGDNDWAFFNNAAENAYTVSLTLDDFLDGYYTLNATTADTGFTVGTDRVILDLNGYDFP